MTNPSVEKKRVVSSVVSREEWLAARRDFLAKEKEFTRQRDSLNEARRALPMVKVERDYVFDGPNGHVSLRDLFAGRRQLIVYHFMFDPSWEEGCKHCSHLIDNVAGGLVREPGPWRASQDRMEPHRLKSVLPKAPAPRSACRRTVGLLLNSIPPDLVRDPG